MAIVLFLILIFYLFILSSSIIPLWNFEASTINLLTESNSYTHTYQISSTYVNSLSINVKLEKTITKREGSIKEENIIYIGNSYSSITDWEDIESAYYFNSKTYICPKGKNHMHYFSDDNLFEMKPDGFSYDGDWELLCYYQPQPNSMFVSYLNKYNTIYIYSFDSDSWLTSSSTSIYNGLFDFKWTVFPENINYYMKMIIYDGTNIILKGSLFTFENNNINRNDIYSKNLIETLRYSNAYFGSDNEYFYFITYDKDPASFKSGYFTDSTYFEYNEVPNLSININSASPLNFYYNFTIESMTFNRNTRYVLYQIYNIIKEKTYYGIIDIVLNKVIFNTDEVIKSFKPYSSHSFLAITNNSAYKICALTEENNECISSCSNNTKNIFIDSQGPNYCGSKCSKYIMIPTGICVNECDQSFYHSEDNYHCGFCKDINSSYPYKILNKTGCYETIPDGTYLYNSEYYLLKEIISTTIPISYPETEILSILNQIVSTIPDISTSSYSSLEVIQKKINLTKSEIIKNFDDLIDDYKIGKVYEIFGDDYNIKLSPINSKDHLNISTYIDFLDCESKLI